MMDESDMTLDQRPRQMRLEAMLEGESPAVRGQEQSRTFRRRSANVNIQKSLQMLDESIASPLETRNAATSSFSRTPVHGVLRYTSYAPKAIDVSTILGPTPRKTPQKQDNISFQTSLLQHQPQNNSGTQYLEDMTEDLTTTNVGLLIEEGLGCKGLFQDFMQIMKSFPSGNQSFSLLQGYEKTCREQVTMLKKTFRGATRDSVSQQKYALLHLLNEERNTWQLVMSLFKDQVEAEQKDEMGEDMAVDQETPLRRSDKEVAESLFEKHSDVRQCQCVVDWLESCAQESVDNYTENVHFFSDRAVAWENTLSKLKSKESGLFGSERPMVDEMDPDAPIRQNKLLDDLDKDDERRLLQTLFLCLRGGRVDLAQDMCRSHGQSWRAATLEGWRLHHDPNFSSVSEDGSLSTIEGNPYRDIWKSVCWNMAKEPKYDIHEKAMYGVLSGNLRAMLPACKSWSDHLWAHLRAGIDVWVEQEIRLHQTIPRTLENLPPEYWDQLTDKESIFQKIESYEDVRQESQEWYHVIQKHIILGNIDKVLEVMAQWIHTDRGKLHTHLIRFMAHLVLFFRGTRQGFRDDYVNVILEAYVDDLIQENNKSLVPHYIATLPPQLQILMCARFFEGITELGERQQCMELAREAGLDVQSIIKTVVENIRSHHIIDFSQNLEANIDTNITEDDKKKIESIDWLVFDPNQRSEALKQANAIMRAFVAVKKLTAAKEIFYKLPPDSIDVVFKVQLMQTGATDLSEEDENSIREFICHRAYLDAMDSFNDWFNTYHHTQPTKPTLSHGATFTEKVAHEHRIKQYEAEMERWRHNLISQTKTTKGKMYNVLLFADGGWMVDQKEEEEPDESRQQQMKLLRQLVLPGLCFLLHKTLHTSQQYAECLQLADVIASEQHLLYKVFRKDELQQLLKMLRDSALAVLDQNRDTLGYELD
ncbi:nuclear pore complex protein Nup107-like [Mytilus galloprovincialis]|uniref:nuclear pore complex protein Nup107-like n=1 Tax=Mytilus galloprovincialis TaxID=29158 RepID=UPI003F7C5DDC